jgi:Zn-dependent protease with chaperone function
MIALAALVLYTLVAIVRALTARARDSDPGRPLPREEEPALWGLADEVAERVGTRPVDAIYVTPGANVAVTERGSLLEKLRDRGQRCLIVGLGALPGMSQAWFRAILAHEFGHFSGRDTAGGNLARRVRLAIHHMAFTLAVNGQARWHNPAWLFVSGYNRIFLRITLGASRLQEILADRTAALAYGAQNLSDGLKHIIRQAAAFDASVNHQVKLATQHHTELPNLYLPAELPLPVRGEVNDRVAKELSRPTAAYDSHPSPQDRFRLLSRLGTAGDGEEGEAGPVWDLLGDPEALQDEMTAMVRDAVRRYQQEQARAAAGARA